MELRLFYMGLVSGMFEEQLMVANEFINAQMYAVVATVNADLQPRISNLNNLPGQKTGELFFATDAGSTKVANIKNNPVAEVMYTDGNGQLMLSGSMEIVTEPEIKKAFWADEMSEHYPGGAEGDVFCVLKFTPVSARIMIV